MVVTTSSREIFRLGREGTIFPYHEKLLLNGRPAGEGCYLVSSLVLVRSLSTRFLAQVMVPLSLTSLPSVEELIFIHFTTFYY